MIPKPLNFSNYWKGLFYQTIKKGFRRNSHVPEPITQGTSLVSELTSFVLQPCILMLSEITYRCQVNLDTVAFIGIQNQQQGLAVWVVCVPLFSLRSSDRA